MGTDEGMQAGDSCEASVANCMLAAKTSACLSPQGEYAQESERNSRMQRAGNAECPGRIPSL
ncbi:MAG: hypothetical protein Q4B26_03325 [Eubacteriales bacterium]|nr:hypothetical protein [Eubacteriales bacterium]